MWLGQKVMNTKLVIQVCMGPPFVRIWLRYSLFLAQELQLYVFVVISLSLKQLVVRSLFCDFPVFDEVTAQIGSSQPWKRHVERYNSHAVGVLNSRESVRDGDGGSALGCLIQRFLYDFLRVGIKRRGGLDSTFNICTMKELI